MGYLRGRIDTPFHTILPNKPMFPIESRIFGCTYFVWDVGLQVSKLDTKSLKCIFVGYSQVQEECQCYCPSFHRYIVSTYVTFLKDVPFSSSPIQTSHGEDDDLLIYTLSSLYPAHASIKPLIIQVYSRHNDPPVACPPPNPLPLDQASNDDFPFALRKGKQQCGLPISSFVLYNHLSS